MAGLIQNEGEDEAIAQINIVPFVDIVLVLLIVFLLTANLIARAAIPVDLPRAANAGEAVGPTANVVLTADGQLFLDGKPTARDALVAEVGRRAKEDHQLRAVIAADKAVRYELVVNVIDAVKEAGVDSFALNIEKASP